MKKNPLLMLDDRTLDKVVKISGTEFDRRRKLSDKQLRKMKDLFYKKHKTMKYLAKKFNVHVKTIQYHLDDEYRKLKIEQCKASNISRLSQEELQERTKERVAYKRYLLSKNKI